jgi:TldD protein
MIEDGKVTYPVKGATLIGNGPGRAEARVDDRQRHALDPGVGTCGKDGQSVPVGVGQPTLRIDGLTVGGTAPMARATSACCRTSTRNWPRPSGASRR